MAATPATPSTDITTVMRLAGHVQRAPQAITRTTGLTSAPTPPDAPPAQPRNPLHGITLEQMLHALVAHYGWPDLGQCIPIRCFTHDPSVASSLKFLRKTPWAREKVEGLYLYMLRDLKRGRATPRQR